MREKVRGLGDGVRDAGGGEGEEDREGWGAASECGEPGRGAGAVITGAHTHTVRLAPAAVGDSAASPTVPELRSRR